jgi:hypothetical protein
MKIIYVQKKPCIRALKQARAWAHHGNPVSFQCKMGFPGDDVPIEGLYQGRWWKWRQFKGVDVVHFHNEPSSSFLRIQRAYRGSKAVFDLHDIISARRGEVIQREKRAIQRADGLVLVSDHPDYLELLRDLFTDLPPTFVLKSLVNRSDIPVNRRPKLDGLHAVYQGGFHPKLPYRRYLPLIRRLDELGCMVHVFPSGEIAEIDGPFLMHEKLPYRDLLERMTEFHFGIAGFNYEGLGERTVRWLESNVPNKVFDYNASGLPSLVWNSKGVYSAAKDCGDALLVRDLSDLDRSSLERLAGGRITPAPTMEDAIPGLRAFYESL